jgi:hypothetical protein
MGVSIDEFPFDNITISDKKYVERSKIKKDNLSRASVPTIRNWEKTVSSKENIQRKGKDTEKNWGADL